MREPGVRASEGALPMLRVAQLVRAPGCGPGDQRFEPHKAYCGGSSIGGAPGCGPGGWRFKSAPSPHGTLAQSVESQTENLFAQVRFLEVPQSENGRQELHCCMEFLRPFLKTPLISTFAAIADHLGFTCINVKECAERVGIEPTAHCCMN